MANSALRGAPGCTQRDLARAQPSQRIAISRAESSRVGMVPVAHGRRKLITSPPLLKQIVVPQPDYRRDTFTFAARANVG